MSINNDFKIRIIDFYNDIDKPIINNIYENKDFKNIIELSVVSEVPLIKKDKDKNKIKIKDKRKILKEIDVIKNKKVKEMTNNLKKIDDKEINKLKESHTKLLNDIESINNLKKNIEETTNYDSLKNLALLGGSKEIVKERKSKKKNENKIDEYQIKIVDIEPTKNISDDYIEIFSN